MANQVIIAFCGEGATDHEALPSLLRRMVESILIEQGNAGLDVPDLLHYQRPGGADVREQYQYLARQASGAHLICVHHDAGNGRWQQRREQNFDPGVASVDFGDNDTHPIFIPVIPVREMEAWLLVDRQAIESVVGDIPSTEELQDSTTWIEGIRDPKALLGAIIDAQPRRRPDDGALRRGLAEELSLHRLFTLPAVKQLRDDLESGLVSFGFITPQS